MSGLPTFLVVGAMRSGTTSLARYLAPHPDVFFSPKKEIHFFDFNHDKGTDWYRAFFAGSDAAKAAGEATPSYMYVAEAVPRMAALVPDAKLVAILRDPVERAYSHYWHERALGRERLGFAEAIAAEPGRLRSPDPVARARAAYLDRGRYAEQLERLAEHFPRDAIHVMLLEDLQKEPRRIYADLCRFLGVDEGFVPDGLTERHNVSRSLRSLTLRRVTGRLPRDSRFAAWLRRVNRRGQGYPPMDAEVRARLREEFRKPNADLARWLGRDLSAWDDA